MNMDIQLSDLDRATVDAQAQGQPGDRARSALLRIGRNMQDQGFIYNALYMYHKLLEDYPDSKASHAGLNALLDLAEYAEENGMVYLATILFNEIDKLDPEAMG